MIKDPFVIKVARGTQGTKLHSSAFESFLSCVYLRRKRHLVMLKCYGLSTIIHFISKSKMLY
ncbi:hypothetical protein Hdeb2414_s0007g00228251 [Helianthus debilis subsp. tardiflorus]